MSVPLPVFARSLGDASESVSRISQAAAPVLANRLAQYLAGAITVGALGKGYEHAFALAAGGAAAEAVKIGGASLSPRADKGHPLKVIEEWCYRSMSVAGKQWSHCSWNSQGIDRKMPIDESIL